MKSGILGRIEKLESYMPENMPIAYELTIRSLTGEALCVLRLYRAPD